LGILSLLIFDSRTLVAIEVQVADKLESIWQGAYAVFRLCDVTPVIQCRTNDSQVVVKECLESREK
jgi:hypothetical protein